MTDFAAVLAEVRSDPRVQFEERNALRLLRATRLMYPKKNKEAYLAEVNFWTRVHNAVDTLTLPQNNPLTVKIGHDGLEA